MVPITFLREGEPVRGLPAARGRFTALTSAGPRRASGLRGAARGFSVSSNSIMSKGEPGDAIAWAGGSVVRVASHSSQQGSSALLRKVHAAHAHCTPSASPWCPSTPPPPKPSSSLVATPATVPAPISPPRAAAAAASAAAKSAAVAAPPASPAPAAPPVPRPRKDAIMPAAAVSAGTNWPAPRERPPTPSAPAAGRQRCVHVVVCAVQYGAWWGEMGRAGGGGEEERQPPSLIRFSAAQRRSCAMASAARVSAPPGRSLAEREKWPCSALEQPTCSGPRPEPASGWGSGSRVVVRVQG